MNFSLSDNKISKNSDNNNIVDDTGNRWQQIHLHGNKS